MRAIRLCDRVTGWCRATLRCLGKGNLRRCHLGPKNEELVDEEQGWRTMPGYGRKDRKCKGPGEVLSVNKQEVK